MNKMLSRFPQFRSIFPGHPTYETDIPLRKWQLYIESSLTKAGPNVDMGVLEELGEEQVSAAVSGVAARQCAVQGCEKQASKGHKCCGVVHARELKAATLEGIAAATHARETAFLTPAKVVAECAMPGCTKPAWGDYACCGIRTGDSSTPSPQLSRWMTPQCAAYPSV